MGDLVGVVNPFYRDEPAPPIWGDEPDLVVVIQSEFVRCLLLTIKDVYGADQTSRRWRGMEKVTPNALHT